MYPRFSSKYSKKNRAFTTLELIVVIATIAVLASLILPTFGKVKRSMYANQSKIHFSRYVFGLNAYYREYGYFPQIVTQGTALNADQIITLSTTSSENLIRALSGKDIDGDALSSAHEYLNPNGTQFVEFSDDDFLKKSDGTIDYSILADRFNNRDIHLIVEDDSDDNAVIPQSAFNDTAYTTIKEKVPSTGLREKVAIFTVGNNNTSIDVVSWKMD
ncbi:MAG: type II secretion system GspH family protein [Puniceicoccales bacterium]|jgi:type II secretory pathway pseudopilin PulG|nr:type II secretion system GspH family protein [Puniceicoccales bacterium]